MKDNRLYVTPTFLKALEMSRDALIEDINTVEADLEKYLPKGNAEKFVLKSLEECYESVAIINSILERFKEE